MLRLKARRPIKHPQHHRGSRLPREAKPVTSPPPDLRVRHKRIRNQRPETTHVVREDHDAQRVEAVPVRHELLRAREAHLLEAAAEAEQHACDDHLVDGLPRCADEGADGRGHGAREEEPAAAKNVRETAADGHDDGGAKVPADGDPGVFRIGAEVGVDVGEDGGRHDEGEEVGLVHHDEGLFQCQCLSVELEYL